MFRVTCLCVSRVCVCRQWDSLLHKIGETLTENDIKNVFVKGNVFVRNKAISSFRVSHVTTIVQGESRLLLQGESRLLLQGESRHRDRSG